MTSLLHHAAHLELLLLRPQISLIRCSSLSETDIHYCCICRFSHAGSSQPSRTPLPKWPDRKSFRQIYQRPQLLHVLDLLHTTSVR